MNADNIKTLIHEYTNAISFGDVVEITSVLNAVSSALDAQQAEIYRLTMLCTYVHDRLLRGDSDKELLAMLEQAWKGRNA